MILETRFIYNGGRSSEPFTYKEVKIIVLSVRDIECFVLKGKQSLKYV